MFPVQTKRSFTTGDLPMRPYWNRYSKHPSCVFVGIRQPLRRESEEIYVRISWMRVDN